MVFALSRLLFMGTGAVAATFLPQADPAGDPLGPTGFLGYWARWDGAWYAEIATEGYGERAPASTAFFPLYPVLVKLGVFFWGGPALWGVLVSLSATALALFFLYGIGEHLFDARAARAATLCLAFFPTAFFLNAAYTEAPFLALTAGSVWAALVRRDFLIAGLLGALAAATRNVGVLLLVPLFWEWARHRRELGLRGVVGMALVPVGLAAYAAYLWARFGDPLLFARQQGDYWNREVSGPLATLGDAWRAAGVGMEYVLDPATLFLGADATPALEASNVLNLGFLVFFLVVAFAGLFVLPPGLSVYAAVLVLLPVLTPSPRFPLMSLPRFVLGAFPVFLVLGYFLSRSRWTRTAWLAASGGLGVALTALFVTWRWVA
ncbi:MAG: Integral membrane protein [uncultured Rubrobacteraceae bacterium]|uniref:Integral membrane protein n=1 Tax=uncultured Rubrobacteraceae bacterium TaxID=349277 RepID=A0A6J4NX35_9ACTN|nr:MAG: Integral membrane protein [uncultured Rubrobacteraceae bacterium]